MGITSEEAEVAAQNRSEWRQSVAQCIHLDAGWTKVKVIIVLLLHYQVTAADRGKSLFEQNRFQWRIQALSNVLQQDRVSDPDRVFERTQEISVGHFDDFEPVQRLTVAYPAISLQRHNNPKHFINYTLYQVGKNSGHCDLQ